MGRHSGATGNRPAAFLTVMMATLVVIEAASGDVHLWDVALAGTLLALGIPTACALWRSRGFEARLLAFMLALLTFAGQLLVSMIGGPGGTGGRWDAISVLVAVLAAGVLGLSAVDVRTSQVTAGRSRGDRAEHPYAL